MKKLFILFVGVLAMPILNAQDITDAVRYSDDEVKGTARFRGMSGAFGALGGDMSAVSINPAGSAIFNRSHASLSLANLDTDNTTVYFGNSNMSSENNFDLNQAGGAFVFNNTNTNSPWRKFVLGLAYEQTNNFDNEFFASGINTRSIDSYFLANAQGKRLDEISRFDGETDTDAYGDIGATFGYPHQQAYLGFESFILEPEDINDDANTVYFSNIAPGTFNQEYSYVATGYNGKFTVNGAFQYQDNLYLGINLNSHFINYNRSTYFYESNSNPGSFVSEVGFENNLSTNGGGFSFQLGGIAKLNDMIRVGLTYDSPTWYTISEETTQYIATRIDNSENPIKEIDPRIINIFPDYRLKTPAKVTGSVALVFGQKGLLSFDYSRKDFGSTEFRPESDPDFTVINNTISNNLKVANTYRLGGELKHKQFSFRGGYKLIESPYENKAFYGDLKGYSLGFGYSFGKAKLDLAYESSERTINQQLFNVGLVDATTIDQKFTDLILSLSFNL